MAPNPLLLDPTRTTTLVRRFLADVAARYRKVKDIVQASVVGGNIFGLDTPAPKSHRVVANTKFAFLSDPEKQQAGQKWMQEQVAAGILGVDADGKPVDGQPWTQPYIRSAYTAGLVRAYTDAHPELGQDSKFYQGSKAQFLNDAFNSPKSTKQIDLLGQRAFTYLKGIGPEADKQISQILASGFAHGTSATKLGKELADALDMSRVRADRIARTEIIHAFAEAQLDSFQMLGITDVGVMAEWSTAGDGKVCPLCSPLQGVILTVDEARGMIPRHPNCRCAWLPANVGEPTKGQKWNHENVGWAIDASVKAETGLDKPKAARDASRWKGADLKPSSKADLKPTKANLEKQAAKYAEEKAKAKAELEAARAAAKAKALAEKAAAEAAAQAAKEAAELAAKSEALVQAATDAWPTFATGPNLPLDVLGQVDYQALYGWPPSGKGHSYGIIMFDDQGRILLRKAKGNYGGAGWTFAKGGEEAGMGAAGTAIKEGLEETGYKATLVDALPDTYKGTTTKTNYFLGYADGYFPSSMDTETEAVQWMTYAEARAAIKASPDPKVVLRDLSVLEDAYDHMKAGQFNTLADAVQAKAQEIAAAKAAQAAAEEAAKAAQAAAEEAAKKAAAAAAQSQKVKVGMAKSHYAKKLGVLPEDYVPGDVPKLGKTGLDKVLAPKNWTVDLLDVDTQAKLLGAQDVVEQKAIVDALKKGKALPKPPPVPQAVSPATGLPYPTHITPQSNGMPTLGSTGLLQLMKDNGVDADDVGDVLGVDWMNHFWHKPVAEQVAIIQDAAAKKAAKAAAETAATPGSLSVDDLQAVVDKLKLDVSPATVEAFAALPDAPIPMTTADVLGDYLVAKSGNLKLSTIEKIFKDTLGVQEFDLIDVPTTAFDFAPDQQPAQQVLYWQEYAKLHQQVRSGALTAENASIVAMKASDTKLLGVLGKKIPATGTSPAAAVPKAVVPTKTPTVAPGSPGGVWDAAADVPNDKLKYDGKLKHKVVETIIPSDVLEPLPDSFSNAIDYAPDLQTQLDAIKAALVAAGKVAPPVPPVPPTLVLPSIDLPSPANLKKLRDLPGSTRPSLMEDKTTGLRWVMKDKVDPDHMRSEALADELYRRAGATVPRGGIVQTAEGPVKFTEFLEGGQTLQQWMQGATAAEKKAMFKQVQRHFVADSLLANHDVAGLSFDNIFIVKGKAYRIDNGGALTYRAQGQPKRTWGPVVQELTSLRNPNVNAQTAAVFEGITDSEIHDQIRELLTKKASMLAAVEDKSLRDTLNARFDYLEGLLPKQERRGAVLGGRAPVYDLDEEAVRRVTKAKANGVTYSGDGHLVEDTNVLVWTEKAKDGTPLTKIGFKVTDAGNQQIMDKLKDSLPQGATATTTSKFHPEDTYWQAIQAAAKTVNVHAKDGAYNAGTLSTFEATKAQLKADLTTATGTKKAMIQEYLNAAEQIDKAKAAQGTTPVFTQYVPPPPKAAAKAAPVANRYSVRVGMLEFDQKTYKAGEAVVQAPDAIRVSTGKAQRLTVDLGDGMELRYVPRLGGTDHRNGYAIEGTVELVMPGNPSTELLQKGRAAMKALGIDLAPTDPAFEELLYLHRGVYLQNKHSEKWYAAIWSDDTLDTPTKVVRIKAAIKQHMGIDLPDKPGPGYDPSGVLMNQDGTGWRKWYRWDLPPDKMAKELKGHTLQHTTGGLSDSPPKAVPQAVDAMFESGGEASSTVRRYTKGIGVQGASSSADIQTGGANYFFLRIRGPNNSAHGIFFKIEELARQDAISYGGDNFGAISEIASRVSDVATYKQYAGRVSNETIVKHGLSLVQDVDFIRVYNLQERQQVIDAYKRHGHAVLPDGRKIEDIVILTGQKYTRPAK